MKYSKNLVQGCLVTLRGDKVVRASNRTRMCSILGTYHPSPETISTTVLLHDGSRKTVSMDVPGGIRVKGLTWVLTGDKP